MSSDEQRPEPDEQDTTPAADTGRDDSDTTEVESRADENTDGSVDSADPADPSETDDAERTEPDDVALMKHRLKRERIAAAVSAGPALDSVFSTGRRLPTPAVIYVSDDGARADGITHTRRIPGVRTRSFAEELPLVRQLQRPSPGIVVSGAGSSSTSESEPPS